jgi:hypothetical protein
MAFPENKTLPLHPKNIQGPTHSLYGTFMYSTEYVRQRYYYQNRLVLS